jgi:protein-serine/threonine kinase
MYRHVFHASTYEEATELLLRWAVEGVDCKVGGEPFT